MKIKVSEATNNQLDWLVAKVLGVDLPHGLTEDERYSTNWGQGGPIIEREIHAFDSMQSKRVCAIIRRTDMRNGGFTHGYGPTALVAAMRCYVVSELGLEVEVPDELT